VKYLRPRYRVDYGPLTTPESDRYLPPKLRGLQFKPSLHRRRSSAAFAASCDGHPLTKITDQWTGAEVPR